MGLSKSALENYKRKQNRKRAIESTRCFITRKATEKTLNMF